MPRRLPRPQVRCCSNTQLSYDDWRKKAGCSVWGGSDKGLDCKRNQTFAQAEAICDGAGARLCTVAELEAGCAAWTGCSHDYDLVWAKLPSFDFDFSDGIAASPGWLTGGGDPTTYAFTKKEARTPSGGTGPSAGVGGSGSYLYAEASWPRVQGDLFTLAYDGSACSGTGVGVSTVAFHYHMYGSSMGELRVTNAAGVVVWSLSGDQGTSWQVATTDIYSPSFTFEYTRGDGYKGDAAVAQVTVSCGVVPPVPPPPTTFDFTIKAKLQAAILEYNADPTAATKKYGPIADWDVSEITDMSGLFDNMRNFNAEISNWDTSSVTDMSSMFRVRSSSCPAPNLQSSPVPCTLLAPRSPAAFDPPANPYTSPRRSCPSFRPSAVRVGVQPTAELRHLQRYGHELNVPGALLPVSCPDVCSRALSCTLRAQRSPAASRLSTRIYLAPHRMPFLSTLGSPRRRSTSR